jgi:hypothetical protein
MYDVRQVGFTMPCSEFGTALATLARSAQSSLLTSSGMPPFAVLCACDVARPLPSLVRAHTYTHTHTHSRMHARTHARMHARTHTHTHSLSLSHSHDHVHTTRACTQPQAGIVLVFAGEVHGPASLHYAHSPVAICDGAPTVICHGVSTACLLSQCTTFSRAYPASLWIDS